MLPGREAPATVHSFKVRRLEPHRLPAIGALQLHDSHVVSLLPTIGAEEILGQHND